MAEFTMPCPKRRGRGVHSNSEFRFLHCGILLRPHCLSAFFPRSSVCAAASAGEAPGSECTHGIDDGQQLRGREGPDSGSGGEEYPQQDHHARPKEVCQRCY